MKLLLSLTLMSTLLISCGVKVPMTNQIKTEYNLTEKTTKDVQFYISSQITLEQSSQKGSASTTSDGTLVNNSSKVSDQIIFLPRIPCVIEDIAEDGSIRVRFETGPGRTITFATRPNMEAGRYYLVASWEQGKGGKLMYGDKETYYATPESGNAYLMVKVKKSQRNKRKARVVKGMKV